MTPDSPMAVSEETQLDRCPSTTRHSSLPAKDSALSTFYLRSISLTKLISYPCKENRTDIIKSMSLDFADVLLFLPTRNSPLSSTPIITTHLVTTHTLPSFHRIYHERGI
mmetsp:Transcript_14292/g.29267  ORF Transcript_14292/g.29267 Transcript_14292/m.29267 type:complete len:110 (-) Transcript_14292:868-1197(-)